MRDELACTLEPVRRTLRHFQGLLDLSEQNHVGLDLVPGLQRCLLSDLPRVQLPEPIELDMLWCFG
ncbi:hypothetical protein D9M68_918700 [compost metagenome]